MNPVGMAIASPKWLLALMKKRVGGFGHEEAGLKKLVLWGDHDPGIYRRCSLPVSVIE